MGVEIQHVEKIGGHRVVPVLARMTVEEGLNYISLHWQQNAFFIEQEGEIVAALSYSKQEYNSEMFINAVYVLPEFRKRGYYRKMFEALVERAKEEKMRRVSGIVSFDNKVMMKVARRVGRRPECVTYTIDVDGPCKEAGHADRRESRRGELGTEVHTHACVGQEPDPVAELESLGDAVDDDHAGPEGGGSIRG